MANIRKRGSKWQAQIRRRGTTTSRTFTLKSDAIRWANQTEIEADRHGIQADISVLKRLTVGDLLTRFKNTVAPKRKHGATEIIVIDALLRCWLSRLRLSDLTPQHIADFRDERLKSVKPGTVKRQLGFIQHILELARVEWNVPLYANPVKSIRKPKSDRPRERRLNDNDWDRLLVGLKKCRNPLMESVVRFAITTGMRRGELLSLRWTDINWSDSTLHIPTTKTGEPRTIPLSSSARDILLLLKPDTPTSDRAFPISSGAVNLAWQRLVKRVGIQDLHFHDLRHEAVSRFFELGLSVPEVALISGHKDPRMLFRYTHLRAEDVAKKLNAIGP